VLVESVGEERMYLGDPFGDVGFSTGRAAFRVVSQPQRLDVKEMHPKPGVENTADVALPATFGADKKYEHAH